MPQGRVFSQMGFAFVRACNLRCSYFSSLLKISVISTISILRNAVIRTFSSTLHIANDYAKFVW